MTDHPLPYPSLTPNCSDRTRPADPARNPANPRKRGYFFAFSGQRSPAPSSIFASVETRKSWFTGSGCREVGVVFSAAEPEVSRRCGRVYSVHSCRSMSDESNRASSTSSLDVNIEIAQSISFQVPFVGKPLVQSLRGALSSPSLSGQSTVCLLARCDSRRSAPRLVVLVVGLLVAAGTVWKLGLFRLLVLGLSSGVAGCASGGAQPCEHDQSVGHHPAPQFEFLILAFRSPTVLRHIRKIVFALCGELLTRSRSL